MKKISNQNLFNVFYFWFTFQIGFGLDKMKKDIS